MLSSASYPDFTSAPSFSPALLGLDLHFLKIASCLGTFPTSKIVLDTHLVAFAAELQLYCQILAVDLIEHITIDQDVLI